jgi:pyruvate dehydrogenase E1 component
LKDLKTLNTIAERAHYLATQMIYQANHRSDKEKGDPKIGGHVSSSASSLHILGALHLRVKSGFDYIANKPHASPTDHAYNYLLDLFLKSDLSKLSLEEANHAMMGLRKYAVEGEHVFQSYHSAYDPDHHHFLPSGTVGIPPVMAGYLALAYRYAKDHGYEVPDAHFWAICGDSEFREGSMFEAIPEFAERQIGNLTWILDYNRQSLDGHRITNKKIMNGNDATRIERTMIANGWEVLQVRHGSFRKELFKRPGGDAFKNFLENELEDYEFQALLNIHDPTTLKSDISKEHPQLKKFFEDLNDDQLVKALYDVGGHDFEALEEAFLASKKTSDRPTMIIVHTIKGWGLQCAASSGNHSALPDSEEMIELQNKQNIKGPELFERFGPATPAGKYLKDRGEQLYKEIQKQHAIKNKNQESFLRAFEKYGESSDSLDINLKMANYPHTQWMLGQLTAKLTRIANTPTETSQLKPGQRALSESELPWKLSAELFMTMAPDVGTSTNLNPAMDGKIFGAPIKDYESEFEVKDTKTPDLVPAQDENHRFLRFEITESNVVSCVGAFGQLRNYIGVPIMPMMTVYDFFIKRALDQLFYVLYWKSSFICVGTPSGITLSPEGAQHGWKSDIQIPNQITWEPTFCQELDWIFCDAIKRHVRNDNVGRTGVIIRLVTRGLDQKDLLLNLRRQLKYKTDLNSLDRSSLLCPAEFPLEGAVNETSVAPLSDNEILNLLKKDVLAGAYYIVDYRGYAGYEPGDNVVHIFTMGSMTTEALKASEALLKQGIYANVIVVTCVDLIVGNLAHENNYECLHKKLELNADLYLKTIDNNGEFATLAGRRIPVVSVHDGEPGLLDNIGSILGVRQISCAVRKHSKCGRPTEIYHYHGIDSNAVIQAVHQILNETAMENVHLRV